MSAPPFHPDLIEAISETEWQRTVIAAAKAYGWLVAHFRPALSASGRWQTAVQADGAGFPDLVLVKTGKPGRLIFAELKRERGRLSAPQVVWLALLGTVAGVEVYEWRPRDWESVLRTLQGEGA